METVQLNKASIVSVVAQYWAAVEFPNDIFIALEDYGGVPLGSGEFMCGSVVDSLFDMEAGQFFEMARIDELIVNVPKKEDVSDALGKLRGGSRDPSQGPRSVDFDFWTGYPWEFAQQVNGKTIEWK